jgi:ATP synthase F1 delta subunit
MKQKYLLKIKNYARVIISLGDYKKNYQDLTIIDETLGSKIKKFLKNPSIKEKVKFNLIDEIFSFSSKQIRNLIKILTEENLIDYISDLIKIYIQIGQKDNKLIYCKLTTAHLIKEDNLRKIEQNLEQRFNKPIILEYQLQPETIGGATLKIGYITYDNNYFTKLRGIE